MHKVTCKLGQGLLDLLEEEVLEVNEAAEYAGAYEPSDPPHGQEFRSHCEHIKARDEAVRESERGRMIMGIICSQSASEGATRAKEKNDFNVESPRFFLSLLLSAASRVALDSLVVDLLALRSYPFSLPVTSTLASPRVLRYAF